MKNLAPICLALFVTACSTTNTIQDIKPSGDVTFSMLESTFPVVKRNEHALNAKVRFSRTSKVSDQKLASGKELEAGSQTIYGPAKLNLDTDMTFISVGLGREPTFSDAGFENWSGILYFGIAQTGINLSLEYPGGSYDFNKKNTELFFQYGLSYLIKPEFDADIILEVGIGGITCCIYDSSEIRLRYHLNKQLQIMAGYHRLNYTYFKPNTNTDIKIDFQGPFAGLYIPF